DAGSAPAQVEKTSAPRIELSKPVYRAGEEVRFKVLAPTETYLYCYLQDTAGNVQRIFPNRFASDARVQSPLPIALPGAMPFVLNAETGAQPERIGCLTAPRDVSASLPAPLRI